MQIGLRVGDLRTPIAPPGTAFQGLGLPQLDEAVSSVSCRVHMWLDFT